MKILVIEDELPNAGERPGFGEGEMPEGMTMPEGMMPPDGMTLPEGMEFPEMGERPDFAESGEGRPEFGNFASDYEAQTIDIKDAHISLEIEGGKASGSMDDIKPGSMLTITVNSKGVATYVLVSSSVGFGGGRMQLP